MTELQILSKDSYKAYQCKSCGMEKEFKTNHYGDVYNIPCSVCKDLTIWECEEELPEGHGRPFHWIAEINDLAMNKKKFDLLKRSFTEAKEKKQEVFIFEGKTLLTDFAGQLIKYIEGE